MFFDFALIVKKSHLIDRGLWPRDIIFRENISEIAITLSLDYRHKYRPTGNIQYTLKDLYHDFTITLVLNPNTLIPFLIPKS